MATSRSKRGILSPNKKRPGFKESRDARTALPQNCSQSRYEKPAQMGTPLSRGGQGTKELLAKTRGLGRMGYPTIGLSGRPKGSGSRLFLEEVLAVEYSSRNPEKTKLNVVSVQRIS